MCCVIASNGLYGCLTSPFVNHGAVTYFCPDDDIESQCGVCDTHPHAGQEADCWLDSEIALQDRPHMNGVADGKENAENVANGANAPTEAPESHPINV